jgi:hypothetical protein
MRSRHPGTLFGEQSLDAVVLHCAHATGQPAEDTSLSDFPPRPP